MGRPGDVGPRGPPGNAGRPGPSGDRGEQVCVKDVKILRSIYSIEY